LSYQGYIVSSVLHDAVGELVARGIGSDNGARIVEPAAADRTLPLRDFVELMQQAAAQRREPGFGWRAGLCFDPANLGPVGAAMLHAPRLGSALVLLRDALALVQSDTLLAFTVEGEVVQLDYRILDPTIWPRDQDAEFTLAILGSLVADVAGRHWQPLAVEFEHRPEAANPGGLAVRHRYGCPTNRLVFPASLLDRPMPAADRQRFRALAERLPRAASTLARTAPAGVQVRRVVCAMFGAGPPCLAAVAAHLGLSGRTLRRRLALEGLTFSELLADCRVAVACRMLRCTTMTIAEIANHLGYAELSAFERAFRQRTGSTPSRLRRLSSVYLH